MLRKDIQTKITDYYTGKLNEHGFTAKGVGWKDDFAQWERFEQLAKIIQQPAFTINDLGCGMGNFYDFLKATGHDSFSYRGYDVLETMIAHANDLHKIQPDISFYHIMDAGGMKPAEYSIASGIFNLKYEYNEKEWLDYIYKTLDHMNAVSTKGFSFNMLTNYSDEEKKAPELFYADPLSIIDYCIRRFSRKVALLHDYEQYDFTVLIKK